MQLKLKLFHEATERHYELLLDADPSKEATSKYLDRSFCFEARKRTDLGCLHSATNENRYCRDCQHCGGRNYHSQGVGTQMIEAALKWAADNSFKAFESGTGSASLRQLYLYQRCGFRIVGVDSDFFIEHYKEPIIENTQRNVTS